MAQIETRKFASDQADRRLGQLAFQVNQTVKSRDAEAVHDLRVAVRRFSQVLRVFKPCFRGKEPRKIRRELKGSQGELIKLLERAMAKLESHQRVADMSVTVRNGRYVIPIRREAQKAIGGIVHDASQTGGTLFVEPPAAVERGRPAQGENENGLS